jgi:hypothetical protein
MIVESEFRSRGCQDPLEPRRLATNAGERPREFPRGPQCAVARVALQARAPGNRRIRVRKALDVLRGCSEHRRQREPELRDLVCELPDPQRCGVCVRLRCGTRGANGPRECVHRLRARVEMDSADAREHGGAAGGSRPLEGRGGTAICL